VKIDLGDFCKKGQKVIKKTFSDLNDTKIEMKNNITEDEKINKGAWWTSKSLYKK
jgi:hypothetical protein